MFYDNVRAACEKRGTTITEVLKKLGRATGSTGTWKTGRPPKLDVVMEIAEHLDLSLDEVVYGPEHAEKWIPDTVPAVFTPEQQEWFDIIDSIPEDKQEICKAFLRTHMAVPEKYIDSKMA